MTEEEKKKAEETAAAEKQKADAEFEASLEGLSEEEKTAKRAEKNAKEQEALLNKDKDYETELAKEKERADKATKDAADKAFKLRELKRQQAEGGDIKEEDKDKPLTRRELEEVLSQNQQTLRKEMLSDAIKDKARKIAQSEVEANLIVEIHKNRTWPDTLTLDEQLEEACAIANSKPFMKARKSEIERAKSGKDTASNNSAGTFRDSKPLDEPSTASANIKALKGAGFVWDGKTGLYVKKLNEKSSLVYNPKTKKQQVIRK